MLKGKLKYSAVCILALFITGCGNSNNAEDIAAEQIQPVQAQEITQMQPEVQTDTLVVYRDLNQNGEKIKISLTCDKDESVILQVEDKTMELFKSNQTYMESQFTPFLFTYDKYIVVPEVMQYEDGLVYGSAMWVYVLGSEKPVRIKTDLQKIEPMQLLQWYISLSSIDESISFDNYTLVSQGFAYDKKSAVYLQLYTYIDSSGNLCLLVPNMTDLSNDSSSIIVVEKSISGADEEHFYGDIKTVEDSSNENSYALISYSFAGASSSSISSWLYNLTSGEVTNFSDLLYIPDMRCTLQETEENLIARFLYLNLEEVIPLSDIDDDVLTFLRENDYLNGKTVIEDFKTRGPEQISLVDNKTIAICQRTSTKWINFPIITYFTVADGKKNLINYEFKKDSRPMGDYIQN